MEAKFDSKEKWAEEGYLRGQDNYCKGECLIML